MNILIRSSAKEELVYRLSRTLSLRKMKRSMKACCTGSMNKMRLLSNQHLSQNKGETL